MGCHGLLASYVLPVLILLTTLFGFRASVFGFRNQPPAQKYCTLMTSVAPSAGSVNLDSSYVAALNLGFGLFVTPYPSFGIPAIFLSIRPFSFSSCSTEAPYTPGGNSAVNTTVSASAFLICHTTDFLSS